MAFSPDGTRLAAADGSGVMAWGGPGWARLERPPPAWTSSLPPRAVALTPDAATLIAVFSDNRAPADRHRDRQDRDALDGLAGAAFIGPGRFSPDFRVAGRVSRCPSPPPRKARDGRLLRDLGRPLTRTRHAAFSSDGRLIATAANEMGIDLIDADTGIIRLSPKATSATPTCTAFSPDGRRRLPPAAWITPSASGTPLTGSCCC